MTSTQRVLGSVVSLWRYPVKSMMGEELNVAEVTKGGLLGDRAYALVSEPASAWLLVSLLALAGVVRWNASTNARNP